MLFLPDTGMNVINVKSERSQVGNNGISKCKVERGNDSWVILLNSNNLFKIFTN